MGIRNTLAQGPGRTDRHSQCVHWLRNDRDFHMGCGARPFSGRPGGRPLHTSIVKRSVGADAHIGPVAPAFKKSVGRRLDVPPLPTRTITAGCGHPALRKRNKMCRARATARVAPTGAWLESAVHRGLRIATASVRTGFAMTGFLARGVEKRGVQEAAPYGCMAGKCGAQGITDCHSQCAHWLRNDRLFGKGCGEAGRPGGRPLRVHGWKVRCTGDYGLPQPVCALTSQ